MILPDRAQVTMAVPFMRAYQQLLVRTCHARGAHAIGGMSAFIPNRRQPEVTENALARVREDKQREAGDGSDGTWVAHPDLVPVAAAVFDAVLGDRPNQKDRLRDDVAVLRRAAARPRASTAAASRRRASPPTSAWRCSTSPRGSVGNGAAAINNLMEDAATAEISRSQLWQWRVHGVTLDDGRPMTAELYATIRDAELATLGASVPDARWTDAAALLDDLVLSDDFAEFLTLAAYPLAAASSGAYGSKNVQVKGISAGGWPMMIAISRWLVSGISDGSPVYSFHPGRRGSRASGLQYSPTQSASSRRPHSVKNWPRVYGGWFASGDSSWIRPSGGACAAARGMARRRW